MHGWSADLDHGLWDRMHLVCGVLADGCPLGACPAVQQGCSQPFPQSCLAAARTHPRHQTSASSRPCPRNLVIILSSAPRLCSHADWRKLCRLVGWTVGHAQSDMFGRTCSVRGLPVTHRHEDVSGKICLPYILARYLVTAEFALAAVRGETESVVRNR